MKAVPKSGQSASPRPSGPRFLPLTLGLAALALIVAGVANLVSSPREIVAPMTVSELHPAIGVEAGATGYLDELRVRDGEQVGEGEILAIIASPADPGAVFALKRQFNRLEDFLRRESDLAPIGPVDAPALGESLERGYLRFRNAYDHYVSLVEDKRNDSTVSALRRELEQTRFLAVGSREIAEETSPERKREIIRAMISSSRIERRISELLYQRESSLRDMAHQLRSHLLELIETVGEWERTYVLRAPIDGRVHFFDFPSAERYVEREREPFIVVPEESSLLGRMQIGSEAAALVFAGQAVSLRFDEFSAEKTGYVKGAIRQVASDPRSDLILVSIKLSSPPPSHETSALALSEGMVGEASITAGPRTLLERALEQF
ncbi:MAG: HlyD family efflux transporter periplasmic adaptor subunit [Verrucomicrobiales bacterium]